MHASPAPADPAVDDLAARLRRLPPSCGPVRLVAVDGHAGSGKSTFAGRLADALGGAPVLHLDDIATHEELFAWTERLWDQVIEPLRLGRSARYAPYDWHERGFGPARVLPCAPVIVIEGWARVGARCAGIWRGWCGWSCRRRRPGHGGGRGTERNRGSSGPGGSERNVGISPRILSAVRRSSDSAGKHGVRGAHGAWDDSRIGASPHSG